MLGPLPTDSTEAKDTKQPLIPKGLAVPFFLVTALFFLWGVPSNLNDVLIRQFMKSFAISRFEAGLVQSAFYLGYFLLAIPAALLMRKMGYKFGIVVGSAALCQRKLPFLACRSARALRFFPVRAVRHCQWAFFPGDSLQSFCRPTGVARKCCPPAEFLPGIQSFGRYQRSAGGHDFHLLRDRIHTGIKSPPCRRPIRTMLT